MKKNIDTEIEQVFKQYLTALYSGNFETAISLLYEPEITSYFNILVEFSKKMDFFGETESFLSHLQVKTVAELKQLTLTDFMCRIFKFIGFQRTENKYLNEILKGTKIIEILKLENTAIVKYQIKFKTAFHTEATHSEISMLQENAQWYILFKSGLQLSLQKFQREIDLYHDRKNRDKLHNLEENANLSPYTLVGYKNDADEIVLEARFKDAGLFSEGLAYVKLMKKYGYIDKQGNMVIKPNYLETKGFSEGLASVKIENINGLEVWGFIDKQGNMIIQPQYEYVSSFSEGLCAVCINNLWGYISNTGDVIIPFQYEEAGDFGYVKRNVAIITIENKAGELVEKEINKLGKVLKKL
jgi:hypothetical protein